MSELQPANEIGKKIRMRRKIRGLSIRQAAIAAEVSLGQLSQVERGLSTPSFASLQRICAALQMPMYWLFEEKNHPHDERSVVVRSGGGRKLMFPESKMEKILLTADDCTEIQLMTITISPGGGLAADALTRPGAKCGMILEGCLALEVDGVAHRLQAGDSFGFNATRPNRYWCEGDKPVKLIFAISPALY